MKNYFANLIYENGIYFSSNVKQVFYPVEGNETFFNVEENSFWYKHRNNCILQVISDFLPKGRFFEIGGGNGFVSKAIQDKGFDLTLIEPDCNGIINAKKRGVKSLFCSSYQGIEWAGEKLDNVGLFDVLEHIENDSEFLQDIGTHMKDDGLLFLTVPSYNALYSLEDKHDGHFRRYSLTEIKTKLIESGFEIEYDTTFFTYLILPIYILKVIPSKLRLGKYFSLETYNKKQSQQRYKNEHEITNGLVTSVLNFFHSCELKMIKKQTRIRLGASCLIVAKKQTI